MKTLTSRTPATSFGLAAITLLLSSTLTGCVVAGVSSSGHFFIFPGIGVLFILLIVFLLLRRR